MDFVTKLKGLKAVGLTNVWHSFLYGFKRDRVDARFLPGPRVSKATGPGAPHGFSAVAGGLSVQFENAQLEAQFLTRDLVRITWQPGEMPVPYTLARPFWPAIETGIEGTDEGWELNSGPMSLTVSAGGAVEIRTEQGSLVRADLPPVRTGESWQLTSRLEEDQQVFGLGERTCGLDLRGHRFRNWNREPKGAYTEGDDPLYVCVPVYMTLHKGRATLVYFENSFESTFSFAESAVHEFKGGALRYYVTTGTPAQCLDRYTQLTGRPAMPPRWSLGYHQARWSYMNEGEVRGLVEGFEEHRLPVSAIHLDIHYMDGYRVFTVDSARFPDLPTLSADLKKKQIRTVVILDPGIKQDPGYDVFASGVETAAFCTYPDGELAIGPVWPGPCAFPDFTKPAAREWWAAHYGRVVDWGVDGVWHDMNEVAVFAPWGEPTLPQSTRHDFDGRGGDHREGHNLFALLEARAGFEGLAKAAPDRRPWILSRSGWSGIQRFAWTWTGDCESDWWTLAQSVRIALAMGVSGIPYNGPDIGGFGGSPSAELYTRWFQAAAFLPFFRTHCAAFAPRREPWVFGAATTDIIREFLRLRYRLMPYWYTLAYEASQTGAPLIRPLLWAWPERRDLAGIDDQFMLGDALLVAPVAESGASQRQVVLPPGRWFDFWTGELLEGDRTITVPAPLEQIPLLVREGSVIPMDDGNRLAAHVWLGAPSAPETARGTLYSDAGDGHGPARYETLSVVSKGGEFELVREVIRESGYRAPELAVVVHGPASDTPAT